MASCDVFGCIFGSSPITLVAVLTRRASNSTRTPNGYVLGRWVDQRGRTDTVAG